MFFTKKTLIFLIKKNFFNLFAKKQIILRSCYCQKDISGKECRGVLYELEFVYYL